MLVQEQRVQCAYAPDKTNEMVRPDEPRLGKRFVSINIIN